MKELINKYITKKFFSICYIILIFGCSNNVEINNAENADTMRISHLQLLNNNARAAFSTIQPYHDDSMLFLYSKYSLKYDTSWYLTVVEGYDSMVKINLNICFPYDNDQYGGSNYDSFYMALYKGYGSYMPKSMWNKIIQESCAKTLINKNYRYNTNFLLDGDTYLLYFDNIAMFPTTDYPESYELFEQLRFEVVQRLYVMFKEREKNPKYKLETPDTWGRW